MPTTRTDTLSLHDALPISACQGQVNNGCRAGEHRRAGGLLPGRRRPARSTLCGVEQTWLVIVAALLGLFVGATAALAFRFSERAQRHVSAAPGVAVSEDVAALLSALRSTSILLGPDGEVLRATPDAYSAGLVRAGHLTHSALEQLV